MDDIDKEERNMQKSKLKQLYQFSDDYSKIAFDEENIGSEEISRHEKCIQEKFKEGYEDSSMHSSDSSISHSPSIDLNRRIMPNPAMVQLGLPLQSIYSLYLTVNESIPTEKEIAIVQNVINREVEKMRIERNPPNRNSTT